MKILFNIFLILNVIAILLNGIFEKKINKFSRIFLWVIMVICAIVLIIINHLVG